ncbi:hypothetical protein HG530_003943 [Fusarium avenaceum]|nr:hypothetical protein HG530_003943 [Fusarium avenaceum]
MNGDIKEQFLNWAHDTGIVQFRTALCQYAGNLEQKVTEYEDMFGTVVNVIQVIVRICPPERRVILFTFLVKVRLAIGPQALPHRVKSQIQPDDNASIVQIVPLHRVDGTNLLECIAGRDPTDFCVALEDLISHARHTAEARGAEDRGSSGHRIQNLIRPVRAFEFGAENAALKLVHRPRGLTTPPKVGLQGAHSVLRLVGRSDAGFCALVMAENFALSTPEALHVETASLEKSSWAIVKLVIFLATASCLFDGVFLLGDLKLVQHNLIRVKPNLCGEEKAIGQDVGKFFLHPLRVRFSAPLETLQKLASFYRDAFGEILLSVELFPVSLGDKGREFVLDFLVDHGCAHFEREKVLWASSAHGLM